MESRELKAFVILAEELNFRKAAERLNMSQPPLSRLINQMEYDLGVKLFNRSTRQVELTGAGLHLLKKGKDLLSQMEKMEMEVRSLPKMKEKKLHFSFTHSAFHSNIPRIISSFKEQFPKVEIEIEEHTLSSLERFLKSGKVDIAFGVNDFKDSAIEKMAVQTHEIGVLVPIHNPLAKKKTIRPQDLEGETLIFHGKHENLGFQSEFLEYLKSKDVHPKVYYKKRKESCPTLVTHGKGLLITSRSMMHTREGAIFVPFAEYSPRLKIFANWARENKSLPLQMFLNFLEEQTSVPSSEMDYHLA
ncbi:LysR family transcriptional regulator [Peredibacter starrii]|uniref:LysR family transcriptional regulator n=1 Tax=Peredibacter starrii TaxID=28202 RepID=A0AAX4HLZ3_9BACT|nr:LysR family transcriptional regulator [Peredibacter starrii]WPU64317.1 LysR family transcriptional regulator [Peredibacter starrii]